MNDQPTEYEGDEKEQATHLDDAQMSLQSKIRGGGRDEGEAASEQVTRLCPGCGRVTVFVQDACTHCGYKRGSAGVSPLPQYGPTPVREENPLMRWLLIVLIVLILAAVVIIIWPNLFGRPSTDQAAQENAVGLQAVALSDAFHADVQEALHAGNVAWRGVGMDCYIYRYGVYENTVPATSQAIRITAYSGGDDVDDGINTPGNEPFLAAVNPFLDQLNANPGVEATIRLVSTGGQDAPAPQDIYIAYGYYYGLEHWQEMEPIVAALKEMYQSEGEYPHYLSEDIVRPAIRTRKGFYYMSEGFGYLPVFKADAKGHIVMGTGSGLSSLNPEECTGYYLFLYTKSQNEGLDFHDDNALIYYRENVANFPRVVDEPVTNVKLEPDGEPDGIACIVKDGELLKIH